MLAGLVVLLLIGVSTPAAFAASSPPPQPVVHIVQRGETMFSIARHYGTTVDAVAQANGIPDPRHIYAGQRLVIPIASASAAPSLSYSVQAGDSLTSIARLHGTTWHALATANGLVNPTALYVGENLLVPAWGIEGGSRPTAPIQSWQSTIYTLRPGDTLTRIAFRYGTTVRMLAVANRIANPALIYAGQRIAIPGSGQGLLPLPFLSVQVTPTPISQGDSAVISVQASEPVTLQGALFGRNYPFAEENGTYYAVVGAHGFMDPGLYELVLTATDTAGNATAVSTRILVQAGRFGYERIPVPAGSEDLLSAEVVAAEMARLGEVGAQFTPVRRWSGSFQRPVAGTITSYYGTRRSYGGGPYSVYHGGVDFSGYLGAPVRAAASGVVVMAETLSVRGNSLVIDHGWGVMTGYWHLSQIDVQVGQWVDAGSVIGRVGSTGLSTGPHLHWDCWVGGANVNGLWWLQDFYPWGVAPAQGGAEIGWEAN